MYKRQVSGSGGGRAPAPSSPKSLAAAAEIAAAESRVCEFVPVLFVFVSFFVCTVLVVICLTVEMNTRHTTGSSKRKRKVSATNAICSSYSNAIYLVSC